MAASFSTLEARLVTGAAHRMSAVPALLRRPLGRRERWPVVSGALVAAAAHVPVIGPHLQEATYMGVLFIVLTVACTAIAAAAVIHDSAAVYVLAVLTCGLAVAGYVASRLIAFPMLADDVGNWLEPLGVVSILSEAVVVGAAVAALARRRPAVASSGR